MLPVGRRARVLCAPIVVCNAEEDEVAERDVMALSLIVMVCVTDVALSVTCPPICGEQKKRGEERAG